MMRAVENASKKQFLGSAKYLLSQEVKYQKFLSKISQKFLVFEFFVYLCNPVSYA